MKVIEEITTFITAIMCVVCDVLGRDLVANMVLGAMILWIIKLVVRQEIEKQRKK